MRIKTGIQNFISLLLHPGKSGAGPAQRAILCLLLLALAVSGGCERPVSLQGSETACPVSTSSALEAPSFAQPVDLWTEQVSQGRPAAVTNIVRTIRTGSSVRFSVLFILSSLTLLSVFSKSFVFPLVLHDSRHVYRKYFMISYMQDMDGRKRLPLILR